MCLLLTILVIIVFALLLLLFLITGVFFLSNEPVVFLDTGFKQGKGGLDISVSPKLVDFNFNQRQWAHA